MSGSRAERRVATPFLEAFSQKHIKTMEMKMEMDRCHTDHEAESFSEDIEPPSTCGGADAQTSARESGSHANIQQSFTNVSARAPRPISSSRASLRPVSINTSANSRSFRERFHPTATLEEWNDWRWQLRNRITSIKELEQIVALTDNEREAMIMGGGSLPVGITPYYASLLDGDDPSQPLRRTVIPAPGEYLRGFGESDDPLGEDGHSPVPGIVHRYPDRVLFLVTGFCSTYCRYCTRSRMVGGGADHRFDESVWKGAIEYIKSNTSIRDVLLSGGDPLTLPDEKLHWILSRLRKIPHVEFIRIGTKVPAVLPQRVTPALTSMLKKHHPLWMSIHFIHPAEMTEETAQACGRLADAGIPLGSQTVLLKGVNDDVETMKNLFHDLLKARVRPYYLYQCDPISGSTHFRTPVEKGLEIMQGLRGHTTGYALPAYVIDAPGGGGKIPLLPEYAVGRKGDYIVLRNYEGQEYLYPDPVAGKTADAPASVPAIAARG